jgi:hypothetical protein
MGRLSPFKSTSALKRIGAVAAIILTANTLPAFSQTPPNTKEAQTRPRVGPVIDKVAWSVTLCLTSDAFDPGSLAALSSLVVRGKVKEEKPARFVKGHPAPKNIDFGGNYAWHDYVIKDLAVLWKDVYVPNPGKNLVVRIYGADTPEVGFSLNGQPQLSVGEEYVLILSETDGFAFNVGPEHWQISAGIYGAFLIDGTNVIRKGSDPLPAGTKEKPLMTLAALTEAIRDGVAKNEATIKQQRLVRFDVSRGALRTIKSYPTPNGKKEKLKNSTPEDR